MSLEIIIYSKYRQIDSSISERKFVFRVVRVKKLSHYFAVRNYDKWRDGFLTLTTLFVYADKYGTGTGINKGLCKKDVGLLASST